MGERARVGGGIPPHTSGIGRGFPGSTALAPSQDFLAVVELGWDLTLEKLELMPGAGRGWMVLGVTYGRTSSTRSTVVTTSTL